MATTNAVGYPDSPGFRGEVLHPLIDLWEPVCLALGVTMKQAAEFVEHSIQHHSIPVYSDNRTSGLWHALSPEEARASLLNLWNSAEGKGWSIGHSRAKGWDFLRLSEVDAERIQQLAHRCAGANPEKAGGASGNAPEPSASGPWPWGSHTTHLLEHLAAAARHWWVNVDPNDDTTAPTNEMVISWLVARKVSKRNAEVMASMLRADGLPRGPRT